MHRRKYSRNSLDEEGTSINKLKRKIRDLDRQLKHDPGKLPVTLKIEKERELAAYRDELHACREQVERSRMISKYHMVRFFERKKAIRFLKQAKQSLEAAPETDLERLKEEIHKCEVDLKYTMYYPLNKAYVSLYARGNGKEQTREERSPQCQKMWGAVEKAMEDGSLEALRNGRLGSEARSLTDSAKGAAGNKGRRKEQKSATTSTQPLKGRALEASEADDEPSDLEDGVGFFE